MPSPLPRLFLLLLALLLGGCSSSDDSFVAEGSSQEEAVPTFVGRVMLDRPVAGAEISVLGPAGESLGPTDLQSDRNGLFFLYSALPPGSRVTARLPGRSQGAAEPLTLEALVEGGSGRILLNYPVHLAARLRAVEPGLSSQEAHSRIARLLSISPPWRLDTVEESVLSPFHHGTFLQEASEAGGVAPLTERLLQDSAQGNVRTFTLGSSLGDADGIVFGDIVGNLVDGGISVNFVGWGVRWLSQDLFSNNPFSGIPGQLLNLQNLLTQYSEEFLKEQTLQTLSNDVVTPVATAAQALSDAADSFTPPSPPFGLYALGSSSLVQTLEGLEFDQILDELFKTLTGNSGLGLDNPDPDLIAARPERILASLTYPICGITSNVTDRYAGYGAFSFNTVQPVRNLHDYYLQFATLASDMLAENAHATMDTVSGSPLANLAQACRNAQLQLIGTSEAVPGVAARRKQVRQLTPPDLSSEQVFVDREYGLMWFNEAVGGLTFSQANAMAANLQAGGYVEGWRLPYSFELDQLYSRIDGGWVKRTSDQRKGKKSSVLEDLGFDLSQMSDTHHVWTLSVKPPGEVLSRYRYSLDTGHYDDVVIGGKHDVLFVRSYVETTGSSYFSDGELMPVEGASLEVTAQQGAGGATQMTASMDFQCPIGGVFTINGTSISPVYGNSDFENLTQPPFPVKSLPDFAPGSSRPAKDITDRVVWSSSNDEMAIVSNVEGEEGKVYWRYPSPAGSSVTITASFAGTSGAIALQRPDGLQWDTTAIILSPDQAAISFDQNPTQDIFFVATVFLTNSATGDRTAFRSSFVGGEAAAPAVTWSVEDASGNPLAAPSGFTDPQNSTLRLDKSSVGTESYVVVKATSGGVTASTRLYIDQN